MSNPDHPIWSILRIAVIGGIALGALWLTATNFDQTEIKAWSPLIIALAGSEIWQYRRRKQYQENSRNDH